jgi:hypothetical protein
MRKAAKQHSLSVPEHYLIAVDRDLFRHLTVGGGSSPRNARPL